MTMNMNFQLADIAIEVVAGEEVLRWFSRYVNAAEHARPPERRLAFRIERCGDDYRLPSGRCEISPEVCADTLWHEIEQAVADRLKDWLQLSGLCISGGDGWILVTGDDPPALRLAAIEAMAAGMAVASSTGLCVRKGAAIPYALPLHMMHREFRQADPAGLRFPKVPTVHDELGHKRCIISPGCFGLGWPIADLPLRHVAELLWNEGGLTTLHRIPPEGKLERLLGAAHVPAALTGGEKLALMTEARRLASDVGFSRLQIGRLADFPSAVLGCIALSPARA